MCIVYIVCSCEVDVTSWSLTQLAHATMQHARHHSTTYSTWLVPCSGVATPRATHTLELTASANGNLVTLDIT